MASPREQRFVRQAEADPAAYADFTRNKYGYSPQHVEAMLQMHAKLGRGGVLARADVALLQQMNPDVPASGIADVAAKLNAQPGPQRAGMFVGALASDAAAREGNHAARGDAVKHLETLSRDFQVNDLADRINRKREAADAADRSKPSVDLASLRPKSDGLSTRELIERQMEPRGAAEFRAAVDAGDEDATWRARHLAADRLDAATATLGRDDGSIRDAVAAAVESAAVADLGREQGWFQGDDL